MVQLVLGGRTELRGREAIVDFYRGVKAKTRREIEIKTLIMNENVIAVELQSEFVAVEDALDLPGGGLRKGDRRGQVTFVFYELRDDRFFRIRSARYQTF